MAEAVSVLRIKTYIIASDSFYERVTIVNKSVLNE